MDREVSGLNYDYTVNRSQLMGGLNNPSLYNCISLIILLPKEATCAHILSIGLFCFDMQMVLARYLFSKIRYLFFHYVIYVTWSVHVFQ